MSDQLKAFEAALLAAPPRPEDGATVELGKAYCRAIDGAKDADEPNETLKELGPKLLECYRQLGMTPLSRAAANQKPTTAPTKLSVKDELKAKRLSRNAG